MKIETPPKVMNSLATLSSQATPMGMAILTDFQSRMRKIYPTMTSSTTMRTTSDGVMGAMLAELYTSPLVTN